MKRNDYSFVILLVLALAYFGVLLQRMSINIISREITVEFALTEMQLGFLGGTFLIVYAAGMLFSGVLADRFGPRRVMAFFYLFSGLGAIVFSQATSFDGALLGRVMCGVGTAVVLPTSLVTMSRWFSPQKYPRACAFFFASGGLGHLIATAPLASFIVVFGWRWSFFAVGCFGLLVTFCIWQFIRDTPGNNKIEGKETERSSGSFREHIAFLATDRNFWLLFLGNITLPGVYYAFTALWSGAYLTDVYGLTPVQRGGVLTMGAMGFLVGTPLVTWLTERFLHSNRLAMLLFLPFGFATAIMLVFFTAGLSLFMLYVLVLCIGIAANAPNAIRFTMARQLLGTHVVGTVSGIFGCSVFVMGAILQVCIGAILDWCKQAGYGVATSYSYAFSIFLVLLCINFITTYNLPETFKKG